MTLVCPICRTVLVRSSDRLECLRCPRSFPIENAIADFLGGRYYDAFDPASDFVETHRAALELEIEGTRRRIEDFYEPLIGRLMPGPRRILDCGCGNGLAVDLLSRLGHEAWGVDASSLRKWQWAGRERRERLVAADAMSLPFPDGSFDAVISSGVIEHIGVDETPEPRYAVRPRASRDAERRMFIAELLRVTAEGGRVFIDCPNGAFPIDFWHGDAPGSARFHSTREGFLPTAAELRAVLREVAPRAKVDLVSPHGRLQFQQVRRHWYGKALTIPADLYLRVMRAWPWLAATRLNPFLIAVVTPEPAPEPEPEPGF